MNRSTTYFLIFATNLTTSLFLFINAILSRIELLKRESSLPIELWIQSVDINYFSLGMACVLLFYSLMMLHFYSKEREKEKIKQEKLMEKIN